MEKLLVALALMLFVGLVVLFRAYRRSLDGVWVQEEGEGWLEILLQSKGPFVAGRCYVDGGHYEYSGLWTGGRAYLKRRDFGQALLLSKGFPEPIAAKLEGTVMAKLNLKLFGRERLTGFFYPMRIQWNKAKTRVESRHFVDPTWRTWLHRESEAAEALIQRKEAEHLSRAGQPPPMH
jgi:hypothetical protein